MEFLNFRYCFVLGTRAELIKTAPVMQELNRRNIPYRFISTGQHRLKSICNNFKIKYPDTILSSPPESSSKFNANQKKALVWNITMLSKIRKELRKMPNLRYVLYHGDTMTTCTAAVASSSLINPMKKWCNVHLEAGLRSFDNKEPFPEEISRKIADKFSDILFVPSVLSMKHLWKLDKKRESYIVGNTILDSAIYTIKKANFMKFDIDPNGEFALCTVHRHENINNKDRMKKIVSILSQIKYPTFFMVHSNTKQKLLEYNLWQPLLDNENLILCDPLEYDNFIYLLGRGKCKLVLCDGGSMQEECMLFKVPCIVLRLKTERQEACETGWQYLSELDVDNTIYYISHYWNGCHLKHDYKNPYGDVGVSKSIIDILESKK